MVIGYKPHGMWFDETVYPSVPTVFNLLGPLTNPARPSRQIVGVSRPEHTELLARATICYRSPGCTVTMAPVRPPVRLARLTVAPERSCTT